jgi:hypothetical protein
MNRPIVRQIVNVIATLIALAVNILANALPLNGKNTGAISDQFKVYFVPAGYVFAIWGVIYIGWIAFAAYQALPSQRDNPRLQRIGYWYALSGIANAAWLFFWHYELFALSLITMLVLLGSLIVIYLRLDIGRAAVSGAERWAVDVPFSLYLGWITVATIANATSLLDYLKWDGWGIAPQVWAAIMLGAASAIALTMSLMRRDVAYLLVLVWSFIGIAVKQADTQIVMVAAWVAAGIAAGLVMLSVYLDRGARKRPGAVR